MYHRFQYGHEILTSHLGCGQQIVQAGHGCEKVDRGMLTLSSIWDGCYSSPKEHEWQHTCVVQLETKPG